MANDRTFRFMNAVHRGLLTLSAGRLGRQLQGMPVLELTTIGRKSGLPRSVLLTVPVQEGDTLVVVASRGGDDQAPAWLLNLQEHPDVEVALLGAPRQPMRARVATDEERARLWPLVVADHRNYAGYQTKTSRQIPLVLLQPST